MSGRFDRSGGSDSFDPDHSQQEGIVSAESPASGSQGHGFGFRSAPAAASESIISSMTSRNSTLESDRYVSTSEVEAEEQPNSIPLVTEAIPMSFASKSITKSLGLGADLARLARELAAAPDDDAADAVVRSAATNEAGLYASETHQQHDSPVPNDTVLSGGDIAEEEYDLHAEPSTAAVPISHTASPPRSLPPITMANRMLPQMSPETDQALESEASAEDVPLSRHALKAAAVQAMLSPTKTVAETSFSATLHSPAAPKVTEEQEGDYSDHYEDDFDVDVSASASALSLPVPISLAAAVGLPQRQTNVTTDQVLDIPEEIVEEDELLAVSNASSDSEGGNSNKSPARAAPRVYQVGLVVPSVPGDPVSASAHSGTSNQHDAHGVGAESDEEEEWF
jgi:hypothetical protein